MVWLAFFQLLLGGVAGFSPPPVIRNLAGLVPFWLLWTLLLTNIGFCLYRRLPGFVRETTRKPLATRAHPRWRRSLSEELGEAEVRRQLRSLGYRCSSHEETGLLGVRRRFGVLGTLLFHGSLVVVALGLLVTLFLREEATATVAVGEELTGDPGQLIGPVKPSAIPEPLQVEEIRPEFWGNELLFTSLTARVAVGGGERHELQINRPLWLGWGRFVRLTGFGYAPAYVLTTRRVEMLDAAITKLKVFPPGQRDYFHPAQVPHRIYMEIQPDVDDAQGGTDTQSLNLRNPLLKVLVTRGKLIVAEKELRLDEAIEFEGLTLRFPEIRYFGEFEILYDPGAPILLVGFLLAFAGLVLRIGGRRAEILWTPGADGKGGELCGFGTAEPPKQEAAAEAEAAEEAAAEEEAADTAAAEEEATEEAAT